jgi:putative FmdB family regulatory protein
MPFYTYECVKCGTFTEMRPMSDAGKPRKCPTCKRSAPRAFVQAPFLALAGKSGGEQPRPSARRHSAGCSCC